MHKNTHREATPEEMKKHKENHPKILQKIVEAQKRVFQVAKINFGRDAKVARYD